MEREAGFATFYRGRKVLITGGLGFIGSNLAHRLVDLGSVVVVVDALIPDAGGNWFNVADIRRQIEVAIADVGDATAMASLVAGQDVIFSLAGQVSHIDSMHDPLSDQDLNCRGPLTVLEACRRHNPEAKVVYASTRQVYGRPTTLPVDEEHCPQPTDVNGINKLAAEGYHRIYHRAFGLRTAALRLTNTYGPRQLLRHNRQGFLPWFIRCALDDAPLTIYGDGAQLRDVTYVDDVVDAFLRAGASPVADGEVFNLGGLEPIPLRDLARRIVELAGRGSVRHVPWPPEKRRIDVGSFYADYSKIRRALGWEPTIGVVEGLTRTIAFYREHRCHYDA